MAHECGLVNFSLAQIGPLPCGLVNFSLTQIGSLPYSPANFSLAQAGPLRNSCSPRPAPQWGCDMT